MVRDEPRGGRTRLGDLDEVVRRERPSGRGDIQDAIRKPVSGASSTEPWRRITTTFNDWAAKKRRPGGRFPRVGGARPATGLADCVLDITATGRTLAANNLVEVAEAGDIHSAAHRQPCGAQDSQRPGWRLARSRCGAPHANAAHCGCRMTIELARLDPTQFRAVIAERRARGFAAADIDPATASDWSKLFHRPIGATGRRARDHRRRPHRRRRRAPRVDVLGSTASMSRRAGQPAAMAGGMGHARTAGPQRARRGCGAIASSRARSVETARSRCRRSMAAPGAARARRLLRPGRARRLSEHGAHVGDSRAGRRRRADRGRKPPGADGGCIRSSRPRRTCSACARWSSRVGRRRSPPWRTGPRASTVSTRSSAPATRS